MDAELNARTQSALVASGIDLCEYYLLSCAYYESPAPQSALPSLAAALSEGDPRGTFQLPEYEAALERLVRRGLLVLVGEGNTRELAPDLPAFKVNDVVFSRAGYDLHLRVVRQIFGDLLTPKAFSELGVP
jgi:hypothetical protein